MNIGNKLVTTPASFRGNSLLYRRAAPVWVRQLLFFNKSGRLLIGGGGQKQGWSLSNGTPNAIIRARFSVRVQPPASARLGHHFGRERHAGGNGARLQQVELAAGVRPLDVRRRLVKLLDSTHHLGQFAELGVAEGEFCRTVAFPLDGDAVGTQPD